MALALLHAALAASSGAAQPPQKVPDASTPEAKLKALAYFRDSGPWKRIKHHDKFESAELDKALEDEIKLSPGRYAPLVDDATFARRVWLDLAGRPPAADEIRTFVGDGNPKKRAKLVDKLLESDEFARRWAHFWRIVTFYNAPAANNVNNQAFEQWLSGQFKQRAGWDLITAQLLSADGKNKDRGPDNFALACENSPTVLAAETARVFMGVSIQCAECHDHPFDRWKREQFHELAAFFSRGKYYMPNLKYPDQKTEMHARFLLGERPNPDLKPDQRRVAVAACLVYNPANYWFARAYVNRVWSELVGDGFYAVDSLGPDETVVHKLVVNRIAYVFRNRLFDPRWPYRLIMNARGYQRQIRAPGAPERRGMLNDTLVVCMGEFGRTPVVNANGGRDHWPKSFGLLMAGAGVRGGQAIGKTNADGTDVAEHPISVEDLFQSFCIALRLDAGDELTAPNGRPLKIVDGGQAISGLFG